MLATTTFTVEDLARWILSGKEADVEEGMRRLARAAVSAARRQSSRVTERRRRGRLPVPHPAELTPVDPETLQRTGDPFSVVLRLVSAGGLDFFSREPVPHRHVGLAVGGDRCDEQVVLVTKLRWCRFSPSKLYENGGVFVRQFVRYPLPNEPFP